MVKCKLHNNRFNVNDVYKYENLDDEHFFVYYPNGLFMLFDVEDFYKYFVIMK